jgi:hypothetical protein
MAFFYGISTLTSTELEEELNRREDLDFSYGEFWPDTIQGFSIFCMAMRSNLTIRFLFLSNMFLGQEADVLRSLAGLLSSGTCMIERLDLSENEIDDDGIEQLSPAFGVNRSLLRLDLRSNHIDNDGIETLCRDLSSNTTLVSLSLENNIFIHDEVTGTSFCNLLIRNSTLQVLSFRAVHSVSFHRIFSIAFEFNSTLIEMNIDYDFLQRNRRNQRRRQLTLFSLLVEDRRYWRYTRI